MATGSPWKLPPESSSPVSAKTIGLSVAAFISTSTVARHVGRARRAPRRGPGGCSAGCRRPAPCRSRGATRGSALPASSVRRLRADAAWPGCGRAAWMRGSKATSVPLSASRVMAPEHVGGAREPPRLGQRQARDRGHELGAVDEGEAFLGLEHDGREAARPERVRARARRRPRGRAVAFADERQRQVGEGRQVAAGADAALRGDDGVDARVQHLDQELERLRAHAAEALGQHVRAQQHEGARLGLVERLAHARGVAAHQVQLELARAGSRGITHVGEVAEAGVDAVDDGAPRDRVVHDAARPRHRLARAAGASADGPARRGPPPRGPRASRLAPSSRRGARDRRRASCGIARDYSTRRSRGPCRECAVTIVAT